MQEVQQQTGQSKKNKVKIKVSFNSPIVVGFAILCFVTLILNVITNGASNNLVFSVYRSPLTNPLTYIRFFGHVAGHADWQHFMGNMTLLLVVGPLLEEKYGSQNILFVMLVTALITGLVHFIFFPGVQLLGASGIVFAFILLSPFTGTKEGTIPITLILVAVIYIGEQIYSGIFVKDNVANLTHIIGGIVGAAMGFIMHKNKMNRY